MIDNHIHQGNELQIDLRQLSWTRVLDMNDRALRNVTVALGGKVCGFPREDHFMITVASEIMAILCLAKDLEDLKERFAGEEVHLEAAYTCSVEEAQEWKAEIEARFPGYEIVMNPLSLSVSCHIGPGARAIACSRKIKL